MRRRMESLQRPAATLLLVFLTAACLLARDDVKPAPVAVSTLSIPLLQRAPSLKDFDGMQPANDFARTMLKIDTFLQREPHDGIPVSQKTEAYLGYTAKAFYVVFLAFDDNPGQIRAHRNRREDINSDDQVGFFLDSFNDRRHSYTFYVNPVGIQQDGTYTEGSEPDLSFDTLWNSSAHLTGRGYVAWFEIPFKSLRFPKSSMQNWGIFFERDIPRNNESAFYPRISSSQQGLLPQETSIGGMENISPGRNLQFIPYGSFRAVHALDTRDPNQTLFSNRAAEMRAGLDAKAILHDSLVLDATVNPDFAQVESDEPQTTVNQRFEVYFPEKRPFFLENSGYFETPINLVFTRRILDPTFGTRLTGKLGRWAIGALVADDRAPSKSVLESDPLSSSRALFTIVRVSRDIGKNSRLGILYTDRELNTVPVTMCSLGLCLVSSNRVGGIDGRFKFSKMWVASFQAITSSTTFNDGTYAAGPSYQAYLERSSTNLTFYGQYDDTSPGFQTQTGFFRRPDIRSPSAFLVYRFRRKNGPLIWHGPSAESNYKWDHKGLQLESNSNVSYRFTFKRQTQVSVYKGISHERLRPQDFPELAVPRDYNQDYFGLYFRTAYWQQVDFQAETTWGKGTNYDPALGPPTPARFNNVIASVIIRPIQGLTIDNQYRLARLQERFSPANIFNSHIIRSKWNYQFTRELSLRFIGQYQALINNPTLSALNANKNFNADVLVTYLLHPGTAVYVGYNSNLSTYLAPGRFTNDGRQIFIKISYLFRY